MHKSSDRLTIERFAITRSIDNSQLFGILQFYNLTESTLIICVPLCENFISVPKSSEINKFRIKFLNAAQTRAAHTRAAHTRDITTANL